MTTETQEQPKAAEEKIQWISTKDAAQYDLLMDRQFVPVSPKGKEQDIKEFFWKIESAHPYEPAHKHDSKGLLIEAFNPPTGKCMIRFNIQKFYRNKTVKRDLVTPQGTKEIKENVRVPMHEMVEGEWVEVDANANFFMDSTEFLKKFKQE